MADEEKLIPPGIRDERNLALAAQLGRYDDLPLDQELVYLIDNVDASALPHLAESFGVMGFFGWAMCQTDDDRRALLKKAWQLKSKQGTRWAVRQIINLVGYTDITFIEQPPYRLRDGSWRHDGRDLYGVTSGQWALIRVIVGLADDQTITSAMATLIRGGILAYKRGSSWLQHLSFRPDPVVDDLTIDEDTSLTVQLGPQDVGLAGEPAQTTTHYATLHNGLRRYNGLTRHGATLVEAL